MAADVRKILSFLSELENNNQREWFHAHKAEYAAADREFDALLSALVFEIGKWDERVVGNEPKDLKFRLMRDIRFSRDKTPYNTHFGAHISSRGKALIPVGYAVFIKPGNRSFLGGGLHADGIAPATALVRDAIAANAQEWEDIIQNPDFAAQFTVLGTKLKKVPSGYPAGHPQAEYLKHKSWFVQAEVPDALLLDEDAFIDIAVGLFKKMKPFCDFLNSTLKDFRFAR